MTVAHDSPPPSPRADLFTAAGFLAFGVAVIVVSAQMPTFTDQGTPAYVAPGIVPGFHGTVISLLALVLAVRSVLRGAFRPMPGSGGSARRSLLRIALACVLAIVFSGFMVGRLPFWLAAAIFVFVFILAFEWRPGMASGVLARDAGIAAAIGLGTGWGITLLFEHVFLIRMP
ncbi:MAG: tripartite tricarboxylate transporter TctB family protein [Acidisphaera sp.]|nr:tripartite tricarboxylate transporter TctB family protein [Acidisphaera sp.]